MCRNHGRRVCSKKQNFRLRSVFTIWCIWIAKKIEKAKWHDNRDMYSIENGIPFLTERRNGWISEASLQRNRWWREAWRGIDRRCDFPSFFTPDQRHPPFRTLSLSRPPTLTAALSLSLHRSLGRPTFTLRLCLSAVVLALLLSPTFASCRRHSPSSPPNESTRVSASPLLSSLLFFSFPRWWSRYLLTVLTSLFHVSLLFFKILSIDRSKLRLHLFFFIFV